MTTTKKLAAALAALCLLASCTSDQANRIASSVQVGYMHTDHLADDAFGNSLYSDSNAFIVTVRPLAWMEPPTKVVVVNRPAKD